MFSAIVILVGPATLGLSIKLLSPTQALKDTLNREGSIVALAITNIVFSIVNLAIFAVYMLFIQVPVKSKSIFKDQSSL